MDSNQDQQQVIEVRMPDSSYFDKLVTDQIIPSEDDPDYLAVLNQMQYVDDEMERDSMMHAYFERKKQLIREQRINQTISYYQQKHSLEKASAELELERTKQRLIAEKEERMKKVEPVYHWIQNACHLTPATAFSPDLLSQSKRELDQYVKNTDSLSVDCYEFLCGHVQEEHHSFLEGITDFPAEEDQEYSYDDA